eukprot:9535567-Lingulodinium_polyedra.AAC.1
MGAAAAGTVGLTHAPHWKQLRREAHGLPFPFGDIGVQVQRPSGRAVTSSSSAQHPELSSAPARGIATGVWGPQQLAGSAQGPT